MYRLMRIEQEKARERQETGKALDLSENSHEGGGSGESGRQKSDTPARADETTAEQFGISRDTMRKEMTIVENKDLLDPKDFAEWDDQIIDRVNGVLGVLRLCMVVNTKNIRKRRYKPI